MWLSLAVALSAAGPRPPLALRGGGAPESELLDSLNTAKLRLHALEHRLKTSRGARASDTEASPDRAEGLEPVLAEPEAGDRVRVRRDVATPRYEWGEGVDHASVGRLTWCAPGPPCVPASCVRCVPAAHGSRPLGPTARTPYHTPALGVPRAPWHCDTVAPWHPPPQVLGIAVHGGLPAAPRLERAAGRDGARRARPRPRACGRARACAQRPDPSLLRLGSRGGARRGGRGGAPRAATRRQHGLALRLRLSLGLSP